MTEKQFEDTIVKPFLKKLDKCWFFKVHGGSIFQVAGVPDIIGVVNGRFIALELKAEDGKPSALQLRAIRQITNAGGYGVIAKPTDWLRVKSDLLEIHNGL